MKILDENDGRLIDTDDPRPDRRRMHHPFVPGRYYVPQAADPRCASCSLVRSHKVHRPEEWWR